MSTLLTLARKHDLMANNSFLTMSILLHGHPLQQSSRTRAVRRQRACLYHGVSLRVGGCVCVRVSGVSLWVGGCLHHDRMASWSTDITNHQQPPLPTTIINDNHDQLLIAHTPRSTSTTYMCSACVRVSRACWCTSASQGIDFVIDVGIVVVKFC